MKKISKHQNNQKREKNKINLERGKLRRRKIEKSLNNIKLKFDRVDNLQKKLQLLEDYNFKRKEELDIQKSLKQERMKVKQQDLIENQQSQERLKDLQFKSLIKSTQQLNEQKSLQKKSLMNQFEKLKRFRKN